VFDVNETLLDMGTLDPHFKRLFGDASARQVWFGQFLQLWLTEMVTGAYQEFGTIGGAALKMLAESRGVELSDDEVGEILSDMKEMPPHPEVEEGLSRLRDAGFRLATLTNSTRQVGEAQIENSGLRDYFEQTLSADTVERLKPAPEPYRMAAESLGVELGEIRLVAAHGWDIAGAFREAVSAMKGTAPGMSREQRILATIACHSAVKLGDKLSYEEMEALIKEWLSSRYPATCPHGRSICYRLEHKDIARKLDRH
jgi:2-haloacid dehalogenase